MNNDTFVGGDGEDTVSYEQATAAVSVVLGLTGATGAGVDSTSGVENLIGSAFNDTLMGDGADNRLDGGDGDDTLVVSLDTLDAGDEFVGGAGTDTLQVSDNDPQQEFLFGAGMVSSIERIAFASTTGVAIVGFNASLLGAGFANNTNVTGSSTINLLSVLATSASTFSLANWSFTNWSANDVILLDGSSGNDTITGTAQADTMDGHEGVDALHGGDGDDTLNVSLTSLEAGDTFDGGGGTDTLRLLDDDATQQFLFASGSLTGVERLTFASTTGGIAIAGFNASLLTGGFSATTHVTGSSIANLVSFLATAPATFSLAGWTFDSWSANDSVLLDGSSGNDTITGSTQADLITGHAGADTIDGGAGADDIDGGAGDDTIILRASEIAGAEVLNGGADTDTLRFLSANSVLNFAATTLTGFERLVIENSLGGTTDIALTTAHLGSALAANAEIVGSSGTDVITFNMLTDTLTIGFTLTNWSAEDAILVYGTFGDDTVIGSNGLDYLFGNFGADALNGGSGNDILSGDDGDDDLNGALGVDRAVIDLASSTASWHRNADGSWSVTSADGADTLTSIEILDFTDRDVFLDRAYSTFSGDGTSDILMRHANGNVGVWFVNGAGVSGAAGLGGVDAAWAIEGVGDFNGDGRDDIFMRHSNGNTGAWFMNGATTTSAAGLGAIDAAWDVAGLGDVNGDGFDDIVLWHDSGAVGVWLMENGAVASAAGLGSIDQANWNFEALADFNGDGRDDILWRDSSGNTGIWFMNGASATSAAVGNIATNWAIEGAGDFNGDGRDDILMRDHAGNVGIWFMNGAAATGASVANVNASFAVAAIGDYNGDGRDDILWWHDNGSLGAWFMNGAAATATAFGGVSNDWVINPGG